MISKRIIACLDVYKNNVVKGKKFLNINKIKNPISLSYKYYKENVDEIVFLNIKKEKILNVCKIIKKISKKVSIPISVGGNINNINDVKNLLNSGADKICLNSTLYYKNKIIKKIKLLYGTQIIVASIDVKKKKKNWIVYVNGGKKNTNIKLMDWCNINIKNGIGEILITSIDKDGTNKGFDINLINHLKINIPLIPSGGGGDLNTIIKLFKKTKTDSVLLASSLHYNKNKIKEIKKKIKKLYFIR
ncbi:HisA/HisF-related TIM barrel protein [Candidatus Vidania fulgoroideorum]